MGKWTQLDRKHLEYLNRMNLMRTLRRTYVCIINFVWLSFLAAYIVDFFRYLCMRDTPKVMAVHNNYICNIQNFQFLYLRT